MEAFPSPPSLSRVAAAAFWVVVAVFGVAASVAFLVVAVSVAAPTLTCGGGGCCFSSCYFGVGTSRC